jgi:hypothetical protein
VTLARETVLTTHLGLQIIALHVADARLIGRGVTVKYRKRAQDVTGGAFLSL